jgi:hypothetical protein
MESLKDMQRKHEVIVIKVADGIELHYFPRWLEDPDRWMREFEKLSFTPEIVTTQYHPEGSVIKRRTVDYGLHYGYNPTAKASIPWEPPAEAIRGRLLEQFHLDFPQCACNEFPDHKGYIGPHHDKPIDPAA